MSEPRPIAIAEHLWAAIEEMAREMGTGPDALVNQAIFTFARINGFLAPGNTAAARAVLEASPGPAFTPGPPPLPGRFDPAPVSRAAGLREEDTAGPDRRAAGRGTSLFLMAADGKLDEVLVERFVIGRGKHCQLVIPSTKVSREHAAIVREDDAWYIEDLGSSNGTWHDKQKIQRRRIQDGDEYFVCSERIRCVIG